MAVLKWIGLSLAVVGLGAAALTGFGASSDRFNSGPATSCGSPLLPKRPDDALCNEMRGDKTWLMIAVIAVIVAIVGMAIFLIARHFSARSAGVRRQEADISV